MCEHQQNGSFGFVINKIFPITLNEVIAELEAYPIPTYYGGPVERETIHFLHQYPDLIPGGEKVLDNIYWGGNFESLLAHIKNNTIDFDKIKFFIGYSGWGKGQLDKEIKEQAWLTVQPLQALIFHKNPDEIWKDSLRHLGGDYEMMINFPLDPQFN